MQPAVVVVPNFSVMVVRNFLKLLYTGLTGKNSCQIFSFRGSPWLRGLRHLTA